MLVIYLFIFQNFKKPINIENSLNLGYKKKISIITILIIQSSVDRLEEQSTVSLLQQFNWLSLKQCSRYNPPRNACWSRSITLLGWKKNQVQEWINRLDFIVLAFDDFLEPTAPFILLACVQTSPISFIARVQ